MNKKIKIIELLQNFADEKEIVMPQYVRYLDRNVNEKAIMLVCQENIIDKLDKEMIKLTDEVEILEDNTEEIEDQEEINIQDIEEMEEFSKDELFYVGICENRSVINTIIQAIKQLDREIKENKNMNRKFKYVDRIISNGVETLTPKFELPKRSTSNSAGYDFICPERVEIPPYKLGDNPILIKTGVKAYMQNDEVLMLYNRSSNPKKKKLVIPNSVGVIDADYYGNEDNDGEIGFTFYNLSNETVIIEAGEKLGQGIFQKYLITDDDNAEGVRRGGFGSTGK